MARQLRLSLRRPAADTREAFVHGASNAEAVAALDAWPRWPGGALVLVLPYYAKTFDHRRRPTDVAHMFQDWERNTQEDDLPTSRRF